MNQKLPLAEAVFSYLITSEYFPVSDDDDPAGGVDAHLPLQQEEVLRAAVVHIDQVPLERRTSRDVRRFVGILMTLCFCAVAAPVPARTCGRPLAE